MSGLIWCAVRASLECAVERGGAVSGPLIAVVRGVGQREPRIRAGKGRVQRDGAPEHFASGLVLRSLPDEQRRLPALEVFVGFQIAGVALRHAPQFGLADLRRQNLQDLRPKLFLDREEAAQRAVESLGPQLFPRLRVGEMDVQPQALVDALDGSGHEIADRRGVGRRRRRPPGRARARTPMTESPNTFERSVTRSAVMPCASSTACGSLPSASNGLMATVGCACGPLRCSPSVARTGGTPASRSPSIHQTPAAASSSAAMPAPAIHGTRRLRSAVKDSGIRPNRCGGVLRRPNHRRDQPVASLRDRLDVGRLLRNFPQRLAQLDDDLGERVVAHHHAGPDG